VMVQTFMGFQSSFRTSSHHPIFDIILSILKEYRHEAL
jgi:hypothetical protein